LIKEILELIELINLQNKRGRISLMMLGGHYNMVGFNHVALSMTGKEGSIQFSNNQLVNTEDTLITKIEKEEFDCSLIVGTDPISHLPNELSTKLASKPILVIDNRNSATTQIADVVLPTAITGIECAGLAYRFDHVPIQVDKILEPANKVPSDEILLSQILLKIDEE
jgi:formylmethanofuran dehydrogenase subunit B